MSFPPFEGALSIFISPKKSLSKKRKRLIDWQDDNPELSEDELEVSPPSVNQECLVGEYPVGAYPTSGLYALDLEQLECSPQSGGDTLEECQRIVHTIVTTCLKQVEEHLST